MPSGGLAPVVDLEPRPHAAGRSVLFAPGTVAGAFPPGTLERLRSLAGPPPGRLGAGRRESCPSASLRSCGGGGRSRGRGISGPQCLVGSSAPAVGTPDEANRGVDAEVGAANQRSGHHRFGQRRRQLAKRSQGLRCQGCLPADYGRCEGHRKIHSFQCCRRSGPPGRSGEQLLDAKLRGEADAFGRSATADLLGSVHGRGLADELRSKERVLNGLVCTWFDDGGADRLGPGPMPIRLAPTMLCPQVIT